MAKKKTSKKKVARRTAKKAAPAKKAATAKTATPAKKTSAKAKKTTRKSVTRSTKPPAKKPPEWNLKDLYDSPKSPRLAADLKKADRESRAFQKRYKGRLAKLSGKAMGDAIAEYEKITERLYKAMSYAQLLHAAHVSDPEITRFYQSTHERITDISTATLFRALRSAHSLVI